VAQAFAQHASIAVAIAAEREQLMRAVESRAVVGQAQGILMERHHIAASDAMTYLRRYATQLGQELRVTAQHLIDDQHLPVLAQGAGTATTPTDDSTSLISRAG
jgi:AmiR/NasT family two-component response regulator